jgi:hypothetical protein
MGSRLILSDEHLSELEWSPETSALEPFGISSRPVRRYSFGKKGVIVSPYTDGGHDEVETSSADAT